MTAPTFALIGAAGYVAPKHGAAIKAVGGRLVAAYDLTDAVGWLDRDWPECDFRLARGPWMHTDIPIADYLVVATTNSEHRKAVEQGLIYGHDVICEKPLVLTTGDLDGLVETRKVLADGDWSGPSLHTILNLRHHPEILRAKAVAEEDRPQRVGVVYHAPRGPWYDVSWKGDTARSGGIIFNIGIHILDALLWMFGPVSEIRVKTSEKRAIWVEMDHKHALYPTTTSDLILTTDPGVMSGRMVNFDDREVFDLAAPFSLAEGGLHRLCYEEILAGRGPGIDEARPSIALAEEIAGLV